MNFFVYFVLISLIPLVIHFKLKNTYSNYLKEQTSTQMTGHDVARKILNENGLYHVGIEVSEGFLSDHYDPSSRTVRLSPDNFYGTSISAASVSAHEVGHAIQHQESYRFLTLRHKLVPVANIGSGASFPLILIGMLLSSPNLLLLGIFAMSLAVLFQVVTLPVEFDASNKARTQLISTGIIRNEEEYGVKKVLNAAAMTYVASAAIAVIELLRFVLSYMGLNSQDED